MEGAPKVPAALQKRPRPLPKWAPGLGLVIVVVVLFVAGSASLFATSVTIDNTAAKVGLSVGGALMLLFAALFPGNVKRTRELLANGPVAVAQVTGLRVTTGRYGGKYLSYVFEVRGKLHSGMHPMNISDPRFPTDPKEGDFIFVVFDAKQPADRSIPLRRADD